VLRIKLQDSALTCVVNPYNTQALPCKCVMSNRNFFRILLNRPTFQECQHRLGPPNEETLGIARGEFFYRPDALPLANQHCQSTGEIIKLIKLTYYTSSNYCYNMLELTKVIHICLILIQQLKQLLLIVQQRLYITSYITQPFWVIIC